MRKYTCFLMIIYICLFFSCKKDDIVDSDILIQTWYQDADQDGFGNKEKVKEALTKPQGYVANADDCNDYDANINPNEQEKPDGIDNNCDGEIYECTSEADCDGVCFLGYCLKRNLRDKLTERYFIHTLTREQIPYYYFIPKNDKSKKLPLIVSLHGAENFLAPENQFLNIPFTGYMVTAWLEDANQAQYPSYVLAPHIHNELNRNDDRYWGWETETSIDFLKSLIEKFTSENPNIDKDRIYLTGHSMGGVGTWGVGAKLNNMFAAIVPLANAFSEKNAINLLKNEIEKGSYDNVALWNFIHRRDAVKASRAIFKLFEARGYENTYTHTFGNDNYNLSDEKILLRINNDKKYFHAEYNYSGCYSLDCHFVMHRALRNPLLFKWLFKQKKN